jgi:heme A synthase
MRPSLALALLHGILGQVFFGLLVALGVFTSATWRGPRQALERRSASTDRVLSALLVGLLVVQLALGAAQRHFDRLLLIHLALGVAAVAPLALHVGFRAWGLNPGQPVLERFGLALAGAVGVQVGLGLAAYAATHAPGVPGVVEVAVTTLHQWFGAVLLALAVALACWNHRLIVQCSRN